MNADNAQRTPTRSGFDREVSRDNLMEINTALAQWVRNSGTPEERWVRLHAAVAGRLWAGDHAAGTSCLDQLPAGGEPDDFGRRRRARRGGDLPGHGHERLRRRAGSRGDRPGLRHGGGHAEPVRLRAGSCCSTGWLRPTPCTPPGEAQRRTRTSSTTTTALYDRQQRVGAPTPTGQASPTTPSLSVVEEDDHDLRRRIAAGPVRVRLSTEVFREWTQTLVLVAELPGTESDDFVLFGGHLDSWKWAQWTTAPPMPPWPKRRES